MASTAPLELSDPATAPDFVALSFYKIFGFPNIGALIVRKQSAHVLQQRRYFGGGTVEMVITIGDTWHAKKETSLHERLEDGTLPFHSIFALDHAMTVHERLYGRDPMKTISSHTAKLGKQMYEALAGLKHGNGSPAVRIYKDDIAVYGDPTLQGATIAFNMLRADGNLIGYEEVEEAADRRGIYVRSGSLCNPGGVAKYLKWTPNDMRAAFATGHRCSNPTQSVLGRSTGVVRLSLGAMSTSGDIKTFIRFAEETYIEKTATTTTLASKARHLQVSIPSGLGAAASLPLTPVSPTPMALTLAQNAAAASTSTPITTAIGDDNDPDNPRESNPSNARGSFQRIISNTANPGKKTSNADNGLQLHHRPNLTAIQMMTTVSPATEPIASKHADSGEVWSICCRGIRPIRDLSEP